MSLASVPPRIATLGLILLSVGINAAAQLFLRAAMRSGLPVGLSPVATALDVGLRPGLIAGLACYGISLIVWLAVLSRTDASFAYPFLALGFVIVAIAAFLLFGEPLSPRKVLGTLIIAGGVIVLAGG